MVSMKKLFILLISLIFLTANFCFALNSYDYKGQKTGSYKKNGSTINQYDKYGQRTGSYKQTSKGSSQAPASFSFGDKKAEAETTTQSGETTEKPSTADAKNEKTEFVNFDVKSLSKKLSLFSLKRLENKSFKLFISIKSSLNKIYLL